MPIQKQPSMSPLDVVVLLKMLIHQDKSLSQVFLAKELFISQSEVSKSLQRSRYAGLVVGDYQVMSLALMDFIQYGIKYAFPQQPGPMVRGVPTAHSMIPLSEHISSEEAFVWPHGKGSVRGQSIAPLYPSAPDAALADRNLHQMLALVDGIRVGKTRERNFAIEMLRKMVLHEEHANQ